MRPVHHDFLDPAKHRVEDAAERLYNKYELHTDKRKMNYMEQDRTVNTPQRNPQKTTQRVLEDSGNSWLPSTTIRGLLLPESPRFGSGLIRRREGENDVIISEEESVSVSEESSSSDSEDEDTAI